MVSLFNDLCTRWQRITLNAIMLVALVMAWLPVQPAYAVVFIVESSLDTGGTPATCGVGDGCTLRQAINLANASAGADTITIDPSVTSITIGSATVEDNNASGDFDVRETLTIIGNGSGVTTISGGNQDRVFHVPSIAMVNLTLEDMIITGGRTTGISFAGSGAGVYTQSNGGTLTSTRVIFIGNRTIGLSSSGGAIFGLTGSTLAIDQTKFISNTASNNGGAIGCWACSVTITNSVIGQSGSHITGSNQGGAIWFMGSFSSNFTMVDTLVQYNSVFGGTYQDGGGLFYQGMTAGTITRSTINNNTAGARGGGIAIWRNTLNITNSTINNNSASTTGGGVYVRSQVTGMTANLNLTNSTVANNTGGGGITTENGSGTAAANLNFATVAANTGSNLNQISGTLAVKNSIIANPTTGNNCTGTITDGGTNLEAHPSGTYTCPGTMTRNTNAQLSSLADNGGPVKTMAISATSPARNLANTATLQSTDARLVARMASPHDAGAFEFIGRVLLGRVWYDLDQNGLQDSGEPGVNGVTVTLSTGPVTTTANGGYYEFVGLASSTPTATFSNLPGGYAFAIQNVGGDDSIDSDPNSSGVTAAVDLTGAIPVIEGSVDAGLIPFIAAPDLTVTKSNNVGNATNLGALDGGVWTWSAKIDNTGNSDATFTVGQVIFSDQLPTTNITYGAVSVGSQTGITGSIACSIDGGGLLSCTASGGSVTIAQTTGTFTVSSTATPSAAGTFTNPTGGTCRADPNTLIAESDETNNDCTANSVVVSAPDLSIIKNNDVSNSTSLGDVNDGAWTWTATPSNTGSGAAVFADGETIFSDQLPTSNISYGSISVGSITNVTNSGNISCTINGSALLTCSASGANVTIGGTTGTFTASFTATPSTAGTFTNPTGGTCSIDPNGNVSESNESNNSCASNSVVVSAPDLQASKTNNVSNATSLGDVNDGAWTGRLTAMNIGTGQAIFADGETIFSDQLPTSNISYGSVSVGGITNITNSGNILCTIDSSALLTCSASGANVTIGGTTGTFTASFTATPSAAGTFTNPTGGTCSIDPSGNVIESNESNNSCGSNSVVVSAPDLQASKTNNVGGTIALGGSWTWTVSITNTGAGDTVFASGEQIFIDDLPNTNISYGAVSTLNVINISGPGTLSCNYNISIADAIACFASGGTVTMGATTGRFDVAITATPSLPGIFANPRATGTCAVDATAKVGESNEGNNDCSDTVTVSGSDLLATKSNNVSGATSLGDLNDGLWTWSIKVDNVGSVGAAFTTGLKILVDNLPAGPTYGTPTVGSVVNVTNSGNISCSIATNVLTCIASGATVTMGPTTGTFTVSFTSAPASTGAHVNPSTTCAVDPDGNITEGNEANNTCSDTVTVNAPDLQVSKANNVSGATSLGDLIGGAWTWTLTMTNPGSGKALFANGETILTDNLPNGPTYGTVTVNSGGATNITNAASISCSITTDVLTCTANGADVTFGATTGSVSLSFTATPNSTGAHANPSTTCAIDSASKVTESNEGNNTCSDMVTVSAPDLSISKANNVSNATSLGDINDGAWTWSLTAMNIGTGQAIFADGETIFSDQLPTSNISYGVVSVGSITNITNSGNISCTINGSALLTCSASGANVTIGGTTGTFTASFTATPSAAGAFTNPTGGTCSIDPSSNVTESNESNNSCGSNSVVVSAPDMQASKTNNVGGSVSLGDNWTWTTTITNTGAGAATFGSGELIFMDDLPNTNISYGAVSTLNVINISGPGTLSCNYNISVADAIACFASGGTVTMGATTGRFDVAINGTPSLPGIFANPRSGGTCAVDSTAKVGESNEGNNDCSDTVTVSGPDLTSTKTGPDSVAPNASFNWMITVDNGGTNPATFNNGETILTDDLPTGATYGTPTTGSFTNVTNGGDITCTIDGTPTLNCIVSGAGPVSIGATTGSFVVTIPITDAGAAGLLVNPAAICAVDPNNNVGEDDETNNDCSHTVIVGIAPVVLYSANTIPSDGAILTSGPSKLFIEFNKDLNPTTAEDTTNYLLLEAGSVAGFQTVDCAAVLASGVDPDDTAIVIDSAVYSNAGGIYLVKLNINGGSPLDIGGYRLSICGTTSVEDTIGIKLNHGLADSLLNFAVVEPTLILPATGFAPGHVTSLQMQPATKAYTSTDLVLEIPSLNLSMPIVGVPHTDDGWDVTWLGNRVGWLDNTAFPTWTGNTVLTGHVWNAWNQPGPFLHLKQLQYGDLFYIHAFGMTYTYQVLGSKKTYPNDLTVMEHSEHDIVTLLTCESWSFWTGEYRYRRAVTAVLLDINSD
jgi:LPXTG-site transpeptidase (sortase) family protein